MKLTLMGITDNRQEWLDKGFILPGYDIEAMKLETAAAPEWIHFGAGNIFRGYIACLADDLLGKGLMKSGIIAVDVFNTEPIEKIFDPFDDLALLVGLKADGGRYLRVIGSVAEACAAVGEGFERLKSAARCNSLKMISFTITEKGYAVTDLNGDMLPAVAADISAGPRGELSSALGKVCALLLERFTAGAMPVALVSMDNCSQNGDKLCQGIRTVAQGWVKNGFIGGEFLSYINDPEGVSFPWSMIDKITPRPDPAIGKELEAMGIEDMEPVITKRGTFLAPFVNAELPQYLVIEDSFPNGRPPLDEAGVYLTDRETVGKTEKMKVMTCLNPLHTALAVFGCLLGYKKISDEMNDPDLKELVYRLGCKEGLPVVVDPGIIRPEDFLKEVLTERLPNAALPDTPQRIACDTSQKIPIRFGGTVKAYAAKGGAGSLELIPLVIAAWLRYLMALDDEGKAMELSPDPMIPQLQKTIRSGWFKGSEPYTDSDREALLAVLSNSELFGTDLVSAGLSEKILSYFEKLTASEGAVRNTLKEALLK